MLKEHHSQGFSLNMLQRIKSGPIEGIVNCDYAQQVT
ncbi:MAG: hypothetical protein ACJAYB_003272 [Psychromonas sp.]|jgi:hypothetical protein